MLIFWSETHSLQIPNNRALISRYFPEQKMLSGRQREKRGGRSQDSHDELTV